MEQAATRSIGIRREDKNRWERRVPLTPAQVANLSRQHGLSFEVESSTLRVFPDEEYVQAGARLVQESPTSPLVLGVKEIPLDKLAADRVYLFFSHTIKGQSYNMPLLQRLLDLRCTLIDYERIVDEHERRLIFFGRYAGLAGMMDSLWALGRRLAWEGLATPLARLEPTYRYADLGAVQAAVRQAGEALRQDGIPASLRPLVVGFTGYGNVSCGAQEVLEALSPLEVTPEALLAGGELPGDPSRSIYKVVFREEHIVEPQDPDHPFELRDYYEHPERYRSIFAGYLPHLTVLVNGVYWAPRYPRLVTCAALRELYAAEPQPRLRVFGDISCDVEGSIQCTVRCTTLDDPVFVWDPESGQTSYGVEGRGPVVLAVDNLPCELPAEASHSFGEVLSTWLPALARADFSQPFGSLDLPPELKRAVVAHRGELTPDYRYLSKHLAGSLGKE